jgi:secondary thiamine-phosphate synthase enzyme
MKAYTQNIHIQTQGKGTYEITAPITRIVSESGIRTGLVTVFVKHTSASLVIYENADPSARVDLHEFFERLVPEDSDYFVHTDEGPDDMPSHLRMVLTRTSETVPIAGGIMQLGTWQGIFVFEHRTAPHSRHIAVTVLGA